MRTSTHRIFVLNLLLIAASAPAMSQRATDGSLRGIKSVAVLVSTVHNATESYDYLEDQLRASTELKLRQGGLKVLRKDADIVLVVHVAILPLQPQVYTKSYAYSYQLSALDDTYSTRNSKTIECRGSAIWNSGIAIAVNPDIMSVRDRFLDATEQFLNDWLSDNQ